MPQQGDIVLWRRGAAEAEGWSATAAPNSHAQSSLARDASGPALRFDFALSGHGAWAIARCETSLALPPHYVVTLRLRGEAPPTELQLKLVDPSGANVWWWRLRDFTPALETQRLVLHRASLRFAWGPRSGGDPGALGSIELAVASDRDAAGTLFIEELRIEAREPGLGAAHATAVRASSFAPGFEPARVLEPDEQTSWRPDTRDIQPWLELDLGSRREWGGLALDFEGAAETRRCRLLASEDGLRWTPLLEEQASGARCWLRTGEAESRFVRLELPSGLSGGIVRAAVVPIELAVAPARFAAAAARTARRGRFPRHLLGEQACWAVVGADGDERKGLLGEDGALEIDAEGFTLEPFLREEGRVLTWADVESRPSLEGDVLPIPSVAWTAADLCLSITAFAAGQAGQCAIVVRYRLENTADAARDVQLLVAVRPFQVTPEWQSLDLVGAISPITRLARDGARVRVNDARLVIAVSAPDAVAAARPEAGIGAFLDGPLSDLGCVDDPLGFAEGVLVFDLRLPPAGSESIVVAVPLHDATPEPPGGLGRAEAAAYCEARLAETAAHWAARLAQIPIALPAVATPFAETLRASIGWILVNREGPRIQPGPRCYRRSWIRDGSLTGTALAEMGFADEPRAFFRWYATFQGEDGRVPCAVDRRGADPVLENDSHGQFVWGVIEIWRLTRDEVFLRELWPRVLHAVDALAALRAQRTGEAFRGDPRFGLLPESISHEGYSSKPVHSFWDDFFALRALADAAEAAAVLGDRAASERIGPLRDALRRDLHAALDATMVRHGIDFLPGSVELGDFDPTSTAIAFDPCAEDGRLPHTALERTFERYWQEFEARRDGVRHWDAYTPYEIRNVVALLRLGWKERALELLVWLIGDQRPCGWRQWPEVSTRDVRAPRFLGDLPHGWVASSFLRSLRRMLVDERRDEGVLIVGAGVPEAWVRDTPGVRLRGLPTHYGLLDLDLCAEGEQRVRAAFGGSCRPPGGVVLVSPVARPLREVWTDGSARGLGEPHYVELREVPREVVLVY